MGQNSTGLSHALQKVLCYPLVSHVTCWTDCCRDAMQLDPWKPVKSSLPTEHPGDLCVNLPVSYEWVLAKRGTESNHHLKTLFHCEGTWKPVKQNPQHIFLRSSSRWSRVTAWKKCVPSGKETITLSREWKGEEKKTCSYFTGQQVQQPWNHAAIKPAECKSGLHLRLQSVFLVFTLHCTQVTVILSPEFLNQRVSEIALLCWLKLPDVDFVITAREGGEPCWCTAF